MLLIILPMQLWAQFGYVDQTLTEPLNFKTPSNLYAFDSTFSEISAKADLKLKVRLSRVGLFQLQKNKLTGELIQSQGSFHLSDVLVSALKIDELRGSMAVNGGRIEYSEIQHTQFETLSIANARIQNTIFDQIVSRRTTLKQVVFSETNFTGVTLSQLFAEDVKFLGRTAALNLRGCNLKNVEFNFDRIDYISFSDCRLQNVFVNGKLVDSPGILKGE